MNLPPEHPVRQYLDAVALGQTPSAADVEEVVTEVRNAEGFDSTTDETALRHLLTTTTRAILAHSRAGAAGQARQEAAASLPAFAALVASTTPTDSTASDAVRAAVDSIPRI